MPVQQQSAPAAGRRWRPRPPVRKTLALVHIAASVALLGEVWGQLVLNLTATLTADGALAHAAYRLMWVLVVAGGIPLALTALASGIALGLGSPWGLARHYWVLAKLVLLIGVILFGALLFQPEAMADATRGGARPSGRGWEQVAVVSGQFVMVLTATALSVFKPRGRVRWRRS
ncbi:DUF2269 domain-containing protein [Actinomadura roseirufa]|uniref:DUF2269 domain-containing protein n=1 Tax=Actinomadura roseirufa TaxID=2094049 RepID=UPI001041615F|nr:DUF2269 domain-containing protein [Actinomadura roseirufa]